MEECEAEVRNRQVFDRPMVYIVRSSFVMRFNWMGMKWVYVWKRRMAMTGLLATIAVRNSNKAIERTQRHCLYKTIS